jgi:hypothetical protein
VIRAGYAPGMEISTGALTEDAARLARNDLAATSISTGRPNERQAASIARAAAFEEALLGAIHARLAELKSATR